MSMSKDKKKWADEEIETLTYIYIYIYIFIIIHYIMYNITKVPTENKCSNTFNKNYKFF